MLFVHRLRVPMPTGCDSGVFSYVCSCVCWFVVTLSSRVLHYSGHGSDEYLSFEDGRGVCGLHAYLVGLCLKDHLRSSV